MPDAAIPQARLIAMQRDAVLAWMAHDEPALQAAVEPLFREGNPKDGFFFLAGLIVAAQGRPDPGGTYMPHVATRTDDGTWQPTTVDELPLGAQVYSRMAAAIRGGQFETAIAHYNVILDQETEEQFIVLAQVAIDQAAKRAKASIEGTGGWGWPQ